MNTSVRQVWTLMALGAVVFFAGCASTPTARIQRVPHTYDFTIVESSTGRELTGDDLDRLRADVVRFMQSQGFNGPGVYYVRVDLTPNAPDGAADWAIVKLTSYDAPVYTVVAAYPEDGDGYAYAPAGYRYGEPYYGYYDNFDYPYYYVPGPVYRNPPPGHRRTDHKPGDRDDNDHDGKSHGRGDLAGDHDRKPGDKPGTPSNPHDRRDRRPDRADDRNRPLPASYTTNSAGTNGATQPARATAPADSGRSHDNRPANPAPAYDSGRGRDSRPSGGYAPSSNNSRPSGGDRSYSAPRSDSSSSSRGSGGGSSSNSSSSSSSNSSSSSGSSSSGSASRASETRSDTVAR